MVAVDFLVQPGVDPACGAATDRYLLECASVPGRSRRAVLRVFGSTGDAVAIGRYHMTPRADAGSAVRVGRRLSGGRVWPAGEGFVGLSLILPHRSALVGKDPYALAPYQVLNRCVRGILAACRQAGVDAFYPGLDLVTVNGAVLAAASFETNAAGAMLFEAVIANRRDFAVLPRFLDACDPEGAVPAELWSEQSTASLARQLGADLALEEVAELLRRGYAEQFGIEVIPRPLLADELRAIDTLAAAECGVRRQPTDCDRHATARVQLGVLEAHFSVRGDCIDHIVFAGDFIANSGAVAALEDALHGCALEWQAINQRVEAVFAARDHFVLGIGKLRAIPDLLTGAVPR